MKEVLVGVAAFAGGVVVDEFFAAKVRAFVKKELSAIHNKVDAVLVAVKK